MINRDLFLLGGMGVMVCLGGCVTGSLTSTGSYLPQAPLKVDKDDIQFFINHDCSEGRCSQFTVEFNNRSKSQYEVVVSDSKLYWAGNSVGLVLLEPQELSKKNSLKLQPLSEASYTFGIVQADKKTRMSYSMVDSVWCSLKVDSQCKQELRIEEAEGKCAGFARYYYETYTKMGGWIIVEFAIKQNESGRVIKISNPAPRVFPAAPSVKLSTDTDAPYWLFSSSGKSVVYKIECNQNCYCTDKIPPRNFATEDRFLPLKD